MPERTGENIMGIQPIPKLVLGTGLPLMGLFPGTVLLLFDASPDMLAIGSPALRILALGQLVAVPCLVLASGFQGLSRAALAFRSLTLIWSAFLAAELLTLPLGIVLWKRVSGKTLDDFPEEL